MRVARMSLGGLCAEVAIGDPMLLLTSTIPWPAYLHALSVLLQCPMCRQTIEAAIQICVPKG